MYVGPAPDTVPAVQREHRRTQKERRATTRARLLEAAAELFARRGVDGVSVDAVAAAAARTSGAVYDHFGSKQGLLLALLDDWSDALVAVITAEFEVSTGLAQRLRAVWDNVCANPSDDVKRLFMLEHELWLRAVRDPRLAQALWSRTGASNARIARGLAKWEDDERVELGCTPDEAAVILRALVAGLHMQLRVDPDAVSAEAGTATLAAVLGATTSLSEPAAAAATERSIGSKMELKTKTDTKTAPAAPGPPDDRRVDHAHRDL